MWLSSAISAMQKILVLYRHLLCFVYSWYVNNCIKLFDSSTASRMQLDLNVSKWCLLINKNLLNIYTSMVYNIGRMVCLPWSQLWNWQVWWVVAEIVPHSLKKNQKFQQMTMTIRSQCREGPSLKCYLWKKDSFFLPILSQLLSIYDLHLSHFLKHESDYSSSRNRFQ